jgi:AcrR family transcriptional regulator
MASLELPLDDRTGDDLDLLATVGRVGRPRVTPSVGDVAPSEAILDVAARLFSTIGYSTTTTREIADAVGLRQGSLFHYFKRKEDMLAELLDRTLQPAMSILLHVETIDEAADVKLFTLVRRDTDNLCSGPYNLAKLQLLPEARLERFVGFWQKRAELWVGYNRLIKQATLDGHLRADDHEMGTHLLFGLVESVINWYERGGTRTPAEVGLAMAIAGLRSLGSDEARLVTVKLTADALMATLPKA